MNIFCFKTLCTLDNLTSRDLGTTRQTCPTFHSSAHQPCNTTKARSMLHAHLTRHSSQPTILVRDKHREAVQSFITQNILGTISIRDKSTTISKEEPKPSTQRFITNYNRYIRLIALKVCYRSLRKDHFTNISRTVNYRVRALKATLKSEGT